MQRVLANYTNLVARLTIGIILTPFIVGWLGMEAFGLIALVGASAGFARLFEQMTTQSMIREIAAAHHSGDDERFLRTYNSSFVISIGVASLAFLVFLIVFLCLPYLNIRDDWLTAARWFVTAQATYTLAQVSLSPAYCVYRVKEQFWRFAVIMIAERATTLISAVILALGFHMEDIATAIRAHGLLWTGLLLLVLTIAVLGATIADRRLLPRPWYIRRREIRLVLGTVGWNSAVHVAMAMHERLAAVIVNVAFGLLGNGVFELGMRLISYVRMVTLGVTFGLDSAAARVSSTSTEQLRSLFHHSTRLHGVIAFPACLGVIALAEPIMHLWLAGSMEDADTMIPMAVMVTRVLAAALLARAISDGWLHIFYGAGYVRQYAPIVLVGGLVSPIVSAIITWFAWNAQQAGHMPDVIAINAPAFGYALVFTVVHFFIVPPIGARLIGLRQRDVYLPLVRPALVTLVCSPILIIAMRTITTWTLVHLVTVIGGFSAIYWLLTWAFVLTRDERDRVVGAARRRTRFRTVK